MDPHELNFNPDPGFWPNLDPDPGPDQGYAINFERKNLNNFREKQLSIKSIPIF